MNDIQWFRDMLQESLGVEERGATPLLDWIYRKRRETSFSAHLIGVSELTRWHAGGDGNIHHDSGAFFSIEGVRVAAGGLREVRQWDQPIFTQKEGGILALICKREEGKISFLLHAKPEPGNIDTLQFAPSVQASWSNLNQAHGGRRPSFADIVTGETPAQLVYSALHNEEGSRFWLKSNSNQIYLVDPAVTQLTFDSNEYVWASLSQIKALALIDNVLNPNVKSIIAPL